MTLATDNVLDKYLWVEKYRPTELSDMVLSEDYGRVFQRWINEGEIPNTLLVGRPGSGKTTLARILVDKIIKSETDLLYLNGSTQRGIAVVKEQIEEFLKTMIYGGSKIKIVFIDEFDYMTGDAQAALRNIIEAYTDYGRFLTTANYESKISEAILSRMQTFRFKELPKDYVFKHCVDILKKENISYDDNEITKLINNHHPDIRKIVGILQSKSTDGILSVELSDIESNENKLRSYVTDIVDGVMTNDQKMVYRSLTGSQEILKDFDIDYNSLYESIGFDMSLSFPVHVVANHYYNNHMASASPAMNYMAMLHTIVKRLMDQKKITG